MKMNLVFTILAGKQLVKSFTKYLKNKSSRHFFTLKKESFFINIAKSLQTLNIFFHFLFVFVNNVVKFRV
jgi:hypothetical protein